MTSVTQRAPRGALRMAMALTGPVPLPDDVAWAHAEVLRAHSPVLDLGRFVLVTGYDAAEQALREPGLSNEDAHVLDATTPSWRDHPSLRSFMDEMLNSNGEVHRARRAPFVSRFSQRATRDLVPIVEGTVQRCLGELVDGLATGDPVDAAEMCRDVPIEVMAALFGVTRDDGRWFRDRVEVMTRAITVGAVDADRHAADIAVREMHTRLEALVALRAASPAGDVVSVVARCGLEHDVLLANLVLLWAAGYETTANLLASILRTLVHDRTLAARLALDEEGAPEGATAAFVEEILRLETPIQATVRHARVDLEVAGTPIPAGRRVVVHLGAAHRDPQRYPDPHRLDLHRPTRRLLSFASGAHHCLGAGLARAEAHTFVHHLLPIVGALAPVGPEERSVGQLRGYRSLPVVRATPRSD